LKTWSITVTRLSSINDLSCFQSKVYPSFIIPLGFRSFHILSIDTEYTYQVLVTDRLSNSESCHGVFIPSRRYPLDRMTIQRVLLQ
jgi:hypothetical protein